jgi:type VI secretion system secreted protein Hcp
MALNAYLTLKGQQQGTIAGSVTQKGKENSIQVFSYSFGSEASGGPPNPGEFMVAIDADQSSPKILNAFVNQETITDFKLDLYTTNNVGEEILEQGWEITNGKVASYRSGAVIPSTTGPVNEVTFTFQKIDYTWFDGDIVAEWVPGNQGG